MVRANKYGARKTQRNGIEFDSQMEADRYQYLNLLAKGNVITELEVHPEFVLIEPFKKMGKKKRGHKYKADFMYRDEQGQLVVEDVKGFIARDFPLRRTLFDSKYPDVVLKVVTKTRGVWEEK